MLELLVRVLQLTREAARLRIVPLERRRSAEKYRDSGDARRRTVRNDSVIVTIHVDPAATATSDAMSWGVRVLKTSNGKSMRPRRYSSPLLWLFRQHDAKGAADAELTLHGHIAPEQFREPAGGAES